MSGIDPHHFLEHVIQPTLERIELGGKAAETLLLGTALVESNLTYLKQINDGPKLGVYQMDPAAYLDCYENFLVYGRPELRTLVRLLRAGGATPYVDQLKWNLGYATAMARVHYYRRPEALPSANDAAALAAYHKRFYNTIKGKTSVEHSVLEFIHAIRIVG